MWEGVFVPVTDPEPGGIFAASCRTRSQTFADQAVIAIENVRLFDEVQARTRDLTEALQQQTATSEVLESHQPLGVRSGILATSTILGKPQPKLCRAPLATLHLRDGEVCRLVAQFGLPEAFERRARGAAHPGSLSPALAPSPTRAGEIAHFPDAWNDPGYLLQGDRQTGRLSRDRRDPADA